MPSFHVEMWVACPQRPTYADVAFLGPHEAKVDRRGNEIRVSIDVDAGDLNEALARVQAVVLTGIEGEITAAWVGREGFGAWPRR